MRRRSNATRRHGLEYHIGRRHTRNNRSRRETQSPQIYRQPFVARARLGCVERISLVKFCRKSWSRCTSPREQREAVRRVSQRHSSLLVMKEAYSCTQRHIVSRYRRGVGMDDESNGHNRSLKPRKCQLARQSEGV
jgi:hypothetical protein